MSSVTIYCREGACNIAGHTPSSCLNRQLATSARVPSQNSDGSHSRNTYRGEVVRMETRDGVRGVVLGRSIFHVGGGERFVPTSIAQPERIRRLDS